MFVFQDARNDANSCIGNYSNINLFDCKNIWVILSKESTIFIGFVSQDLCDEFPIEIHDLQNRVRFFLLQLFFLQNAKLCKLRVYFVLDKSDCFFNINICRHLTGCSGSKLSQLYS